MELIRNVVMSEGAAVTASAVVRFFTETSDITDFSDDRTIFRGVFDWRLM